MTRLGAFVLVACTSACAGDPTPARANAKAAEAPAASEAPTAAETPAASKTDPCKPLPKEGDPCDGKTAYCVADWGEPGGHSTALWCRDGRWVIEEEANL